MNGVQKLIDKVKQPDKAGTAVLAEAFEVSLQAIHKFARQGYLPLDRARLASSKFDVPLRDLVRADVRDAMDNATASTSV